NVEPGGRRSRPCWTTRTPGSTPPWSRPTWPPARPAGPTRPRPAACSAGCGCGRAARARPGAPRARVGGGGGPAEPVPDLTPAILARIGPTEPGLRQGAQREVRIALAVLAGLVAVLPLPVPLFAGEAGTPLHLRW